MAEVLQPVSIPFPEPGSERPAEMRARFESTAVPLMSLVHATARRLARGGDDARDLVQETYLRAYRTFGGFTPGTNMRAWLLTILYSVFINRYRRDQRTPPHVEVTEAEKTAPLGLSDANLAADVIEQSLDAWSSREVETALSTLPDVFRDAVLLVDVEELSYEEAAAVLATPVGTVRSRLYRGRKLLHAALLELGRRRGYVKTVGEVPHE